MNEVVTDEGNESDAVIDIMYVPISATEVETTSISKGLAIIVKIPDGIETAAPALNE